MLDARLTTALHVQSLRHDGLHPEHEPHMLFQASTIAALLEGAYEGDVSFAELAEHGDFGLGTLNHLDGEMTAVDGRFYRADLDGRVNEVDPAEQTPFAVVTFFAPTVDVAVGASTGVADLVDGLRPPGGACAVRLDGEFDLVRARSVPRQEPPYRPLADVVAEQHIFEFERVRGTLVGFSFPDYALGLEVSGLHLHFLDESRGRGGHVLDCRVREGRLRIDPEGGWRIELPPGVELDPQHVDEKILAGIEGNSG
jgi:acetolactate decarboxylase